MTGNEVLHYRIDAPLGQGGMGQVFRATDMRLGRTVALKFLPESVARDASLRARLMVEAQAVSRLSSPFVTTLFDVVEHDDILFLVLEYVDGESLSARLSRGALPVDDALSVAAQIAHALTEAHERGVVHRDIKPSNVMFNRSGKVKVLDFGLARLCDPEQGRIPTLVQPPLTVPGSILGTCGYMSPEQALGDEVDHRTDLFSLGVLLYEMLCGVRPFRSEAPVRLIDQIVHAPTPPLEGPGARAPEAVWRIVRRALEKNRALRYQTAREMAADLEGAADPPALSTGVVGSGLPAAASRVCIRHAVAVATFANLTRRPEDAWLGTAIAETVTADLKRVKGLAVIDRDRICLADMDAARVGAGAPDADGVAIAGQTVGATWVVAGGFQRSGDTVRITARFTDAETGVVLRTIKIDGPLSQIFDLEDRIVRDLCDQLDFDLARSEISAIERKETKSIEAYRAYSRGLADLRSGEPEAIERATTHLGEAVDLDASYAAAWAALGVAYYLKGASFARRDLVFEALDFERKALALDPVNLMAHECLSSAHLSLGDVESAVAAAREAIRIDPERATARAIHGRAYWLGRGMLGEGIRELERATALDPNLGYAYIQMGFLYAITGDFERAEAASRRAVELQDRNASGTLGLQLIGARARFGYVLYRTGRYEEAVAEYLTERRGVEAGRHLLRDRTLIELDQKLGAACLRLGREREAAEYLERAVVSARERGARRPLDPATSYYVACAHALRGEQAAALAALHLTAAHHPALTALRASGDPDLDGCREEPEFRRLVAGALEGNTLACEP